MYMYTSVVEKSAGRNIERKQYVVLIEKEVSKSGSDR